MAALFLQLKPPSSIPWSLSSVTSRTIRGQKNLVPTAELRNGFMSLSENSSQGRGFGSGFKVWGLDNRAPVVTVAAGAGEGETRESDVVPERIREPSEENSNSQDLTLHRRNLFLYAGFCVIVLMRDVILREFAAWGIDFGRIALYVAEGVAIGLGKLTNILAEPIAFLISILSWAIMVITDVYTLIVDGAPVKSLFYCLLLSLAVLSIGDATSCKIQGSRSRLVGIATAVGLAGVLDYIPPEAVLLCLLLLTAFAKLIQKADLVTVFMPATVTFVAISEPVLQAAAFGVFLAVSVYANWRFGAQGLVTQTPSGIPQESGEATTPSEVREMEARVGMRDSIVFSIISASICISWAARVLYLCSVKWLLVRTT